MENTRALILGILLEVMEEGNYSHLVIRSVLDKYQYLEKQERAFITRVAEGTIQTAIELDYIINQFSKVKVNKMKPVIRNLLRMSVYQMKYMDSVPDSAACNEAVKLARKKGFSSLSGFVNGVLRNISRGLSSITYPDEKKEPVAYYSVKYSMPEWIVKQWIADYGVEITSTTLEAFAKEYSVEYDKKEKKLKNFKLFIIMDTDDCDQSTKEKYISGELFRGHALQEYIVPIYNIKNFEDVMIKAGIMVKRIPATEKGHYYSKIFPINVHPLNCDTINQVKTFAHRIKGVKETNLLEFVEYCIQQIPGESLWEFGKPFS